MGARLKSVVTGGVSELAPGYFALTMATGIVSISAQLLGAESLAKILFVINIIAYVVLWLMTLGRLFFFSPLLSADFINHAKGAGFFTIIAGTCVVGSQFILVWQNVRIASVLWVLGLFLWLFLVYAFLTAVTVVDVKPGSQQGLNAVWLLLVVSTQSVSVLGTLISPSYPEWREPILFFTLSMFMIGCMLYVIIISLIFYRWTFYPLPPNMITPPYWISMGAVAITTLAGSRLILATPRWQLIDDMLPFLKGFILFFWATGTWWIPILVILGIWLHGYKRVPLKYDPMFWSMVFPLGMYTASTLQLAKALNIPGLEVIPRYFFFVAMLAWALTFFGLVRRIVSKVFSASMI